MPEYDFLASVREDLEMLRQELAGPGVDDAIREIVRRTGASEREALAVLWRTSKRHGETMSVFAAELAEQFQRETAAAKTA